MNHPASHSQPAVGTVEVPKAKGPWAAQEGPRYHQHKMIYPLIGHCSGDHPPVVVLCPLHRYSRLHGGETVVGIRELKNGLSHQFHPLLWSL